MRLTIFCRFFILTVMVILADGCEYMRREEYKEETFNYFGVNFNKQRKKLNLSVIPDSLWGARNVIVSGNIGQCTFWKIIPDNSYDTTARHAMKETFFYVNDRQPIREVDYYYSGKKYMEMDPDFHNWERLEIVHDFVTDSIPELGNLSLQLQNNLLKTVKGTKRAYLVGPHLPNPPVDRSTGKRRLPNLMSEPITSLQADSVLKSWGIQSL